MSGSRGAGQAAPAGVPLQETGLRKLVRIQPREILSITPLPRAVHLGFVISQQDHLRSLPLHCLLLLDSDISHSSQLFLHPSFLSAFFCSSASHLSVYVSAFMCFVFMCSGGGGGGGIHRRLRSFVRVGLAMNNNTWLLRAAV